MPGPECEKAGEGKWCVDCGDPFVAEEGETTATCAGGECAVAATESSLLAVGSTSCQRAGLDLFTTPSPHSSYLLFTDW
jgi:hypothetical protein